MTNQPILISTKRSTNMTKILVYSKKDCPNCDTLKQLLKRENIEYQTINIFTPEAMTELAMNNVITRSAPVLQIDKKFYTVRELCPNMVDIDTNIAKSIIKGDMTY